ncbi:MerR family transcriptional regulator [Limosilactobacillus vaginalis]|uniref:MerR family transcriptional regulator n=1 Tax=Limosilactobacillus vaginalis TaxID=1633 RepID=UPI00241DBBFE|nr:MerR family transcriptional regulator [Limosilactobacillus vaginalis]
MFTTKTLEDLFHIGRDSIRYYEQIGVLTPKIDQKNGYHYYDDLDIDILSRIVKFRGLDFSLKEIHQLRNSQNIIEYLQQIQAKSLAYQRKAQHYQVIADYLDKTATDIINSIQQKKIFIKDDFFIKLAYQNWEEVFNHQASYDNYRDIKHRSQFAMADFIIFLKPTDDFGHFFIDNAGTAFSKEELLLNKISSKGFKHFNYPQVYRSYINQPITMHRIINLQKELQEIYNDGFKIVDNPYLRQIVVLEKQIRILQINIPITPQKDPDASE